MKRRGFPTDRAYTAVLSIVLTLLAAGSAPGFTLSRSQDPSGGAWHTRRWSDDTHKVRYQLNSLPLNVLSNLTSASTPQLAVEAAMRAWAIAPQEFYLDGTTDITDQRPDGTNVISFANTPANRDASGTNGVATTATWSHLEGDVWLIDESDTVFNPTLKFDTTGAADAYDIQAILTHELGHAHGLSHSAIRSAVMYPAAVPGSTLARSLTSDEIGGIRTLYPVTADPSLGAISGRVLTTAGQPVFGSHVAATNAEGIIVVGALTDKDGTYLLPQLPPGRYQVYAEPLNQTATPADFGNGYYKSAETDFLPAFAGGNATTAPVQVTAGATTSLDALRVRVHATRLTSPLVAWSPDGNSVYGGDWVVIPSGRTVLFLIGANNLDSVPDDGLSISGSDITLDQRYIYRDTANGLPVAVFPLSIRSGTQPGARNLYLTSDNDQVVLSGAMVVTR